MATGVGPPGVQSDQGTRKLGKHDLKVILDALLPVAGKYEFFGIQIGFEMSEIDEIRKQCTDSRQCLLRILDTRLRQTPALTWNDIDTALRSKSVNESGLANEYGHLFIHEQTSESHEDGRKGSEKKHKSTKKKGKYVGEDRSRQVGKERETDSDEEVSESQGFKKSSEIPRTDDKSTKTQRKVKKAKKPLEPEKGSERERKQRRDKKKHADISPISESKVAKNSRERLKGSSQKCKEISEQRAPKEVLMKYESEPSSGKYESKVIHKSKHKRKDSGRSGRKCSEKKQVLLKSESISSSEEEIVRSKYERKVIHKSEEQLRKSSRKCSEQIAPKEVQSKSESESSASSSEEEMVKVDESETAEEYSSKQEIDSDHQKVSESDRKSDNISTKAQQRVKKAKKHSEPEQGNAKREQKAQIKQQARHEANIESKVRHKGSHTSTCKEQIAPKEVQVKSESESSVSSSEEETVEVDESETAEKYSSEQEIDSDNEEVSESGRKSDNISTKTQRRVKKAKKHSEPEQGNAKREQKGQMKQQARHGAKIESKVRHKDSHTGTCKAPKVVQSKSESESSVSSSEEETVEVGESETAEEYSSEQEQYSDNEEVSEDSAEQTREGEYPSDSEVKVKTKKTKGFLCPGNERQKYESIDQQSFQMESDKGNRYKSSAEMDAQKHKLRKKQRPEGEIGCHVPDEIVASSSHSGGKAGKSQTVEKTRPSKQIQGKEEERRKAEKQTETKAKQRAQITEEQYSDEEVREKPALKPAGRKEHKKSKREDYDSGEDMNEDKHNGARMTQYPISRISDTHTEEKREKDKISTKAIKSSGKTKKGKYHKSDSRQRKDKLATKQRGKGTPSSDVTEEDSEDEEASSKGSDGEVRRRLAGKSKRIKSEGEYSTASASKGDRSIVIYHDKAKQSSQKLIEEKESQRGKYTSGKGFIRSMEKSSMKGHRSKEMEANKPDKKPPTKGKYLKGHSKTQRESKREVEAAVEKSEKTSDEHESESADSSEGEEEDRDSEQKSSVEEEKGDDKEDDKYSATSSEEEVKRKVFRTPDRFRCEEERRQKTKDKSIALATNVQDKRGGYQSYRGGRDRDQEKHIIKPKKRSRRRHRESSPIARGSSSPSTSQEEQQVQKRKSKRETDRERRKMDVKKKEKREKVSSSSATDDSSPESEMLRNLTQSETKALVRVFKCLFGRLCCAIKDPVETAAQLQEKHLISRSTMENIITSPESQQVKAITLVRALDRKIKPRPDKIFTVTKVFLENEILQDVGRQLWAETGKICPDRTASILGSESPSLERQLSVESVERHDMPGKTLQPEIATPTCLSPEEEPVPVLVHSESQPTAQSEMPMQTQLSPTAETSSGTSPSQGVSQSVQQSVGLSPVLAKYKRYLQSVYNARVLAPADKYLPTLEAPYINLAMIRRERYNTEQRDEFTRQTLHGGVDQILQSKTPINIEDLLTPEPLKESPRLLIVRRRHFRKIQHKKRGRLEDNEFPVTDSPSSHLSQTPEEGGRFILVEGPPGIGKSTFAWEACRRWDEIESLRHYHTVVLLKLREKWVLNATSLSDILRYPSHPDFSKSIAEELVNVQGRNLLLILDGFDEVSHSFHENSVIKSILCRQLLPECTIILTTRPVAKAALKSICQPRVDKHVEIIGFTEEERVRYITEVFSKEPELQVNFLKYMFLVPHIKSMMYIPLNCAIIAQVYYESQSSRHLTTRTQLYKALTHSLLVRHMKMKNSDFEYESMLPEGLDKERKEMFKGLAKFAFDIYHKGITTYLSRRHYLFRQNRHETESRKVTFFKEDIPEGLVHFGFMNESTEMYAGKGVERTFSFLHLSLQEYLAAWHLANSYSIEFQVAYHRLTVSGYLEYKGDNKEEEALISSLWYQRSSLVEPAIFLAGITGWKYQSEDDRNHWEMYLSHDTADVSDTSVLLRSFYEAQNPTLVPLYFASNSRRNVCIGSRVIRLSDPKTPYECYALSFCLANSSEEYGFSLSLTFNSDYDISLVETFVKGLNDHCKSTTPLIVESLLIEGSSQPSLVDRGLLWLVRANLLNTKECCLDPTIINSSVAHQFLQTLHNLQSLDVSSVYLDFPPITSWEWLAGIRSLSELKKLHISNSEECSLPPTDSLSWLVEHRMRVVVLDVRFPCNTIYELQNPTDALVHSVLKSVLRSNEITKLVLPNVSRGTMAGVRSILLHCPSLTKLDLERTRLGYDGILYICSALRNNTTLTRLVIHDDLQLPQFREKKRQGDSTIITTFSSMEIVPLPSKTTPTDFLLEINNILKDNTTLEEMYIQSGLFLPLSLSAGGDGEYCQWTGLGPLQQFNVGAVASRMSPNLRKSFSISDLTQPQTQLFWDRKSYYDYGVNAEVNFKKLFSRRKVERNKLFSGPSFTATDTQVLHSFSGLDPRLKECLEISHLQQYVDTLKYTYWKMLDTVRRRYRGDSDDDSYDSDLYL